MHYAPESAASREKEEGKPPRDELSILLTRKEASIDLRISERMIDKLIAEGILPTIRIGRRVLIRRNDLVKLAGSSYVKLKRRIFVDRAKSGSDHSKRGAA